MKKVGNKISAMSATNWAWLVMVLLLIAVIYQLISLALNLFFSKPLNIVEPAPTVAVAAKKVNLQQLHLFGQKPVEQVQQALKPTTLPLTLKGIFVNQNNQLSSAVIEASGYPEKLYWVGDKLPGDAKLAEVLSDRVIITRNGNREVLLMPHQDLSSKSTQFPDLTINSNAR